jgi:hypothetical protein
MEIGRLSKEDDLPRVLYLLYMDGLDKNGSPTHNKSKVKGLHNNSTLQLDFKTDLNELCPICMQLF